MFTGIVTNIGTVESVEENASLRRFRVQADYEAASISIGASICHDGCCLTAMDIEPADDGCSYAVDATAETLARTNLGTWKPGKRINLERSLSLGDEMGGHLVTGHVDDVATIVEMVPFDDSIRFVFDAPATLSPFIAQKGSIALDGTSLTVNGIEGNRFHIMLIPHTLEVTTWSDRQVGDRVNLEVDLMARYAARLKEADPGKWG